MACDDGIRLTCYDYYWKRHRFAAAALVGHGTGLLVCDEVHQLSKSRSG
mgnify:CR=1 FL=1